MKYKYIAYTLLLALTSIVTQAQVKIGNNPTTITPGALLDIEGSTATTRTVSLPNGNFGIGTTAPIAKLDVGGNIGFSNNLTNGQLAGVSNTLFIIEGTNGLQINNNANSLNHVVVTSAGDVGIGTPSPVTKLDVGGSIGFSNNLGNGSIVGFNNQLVMKTGSSNLSVYNNAGNANLMTLLNNGNMGLGTSGPVAKLDIVGNVRIADGTQGTGKILTSDGNGVASWQNLQGLNIVKVVFAGRSATDFNFSPGSNFFPQINPVFAAPGYNAATNTFTIQESGYYRITGGAQFNGTSETPGNFVRVYISGDNFPSSFQQFDNISTGQFPALAAFWDAYLPAGSRIVMSVYTGGTNPQTVKVYGGAFLTVMRII